MSSNPMTIRHSLTKLGRAPWLLAALAVAAAFGCDEGRLQESDAGVDSGAARPADANVAPTDAPPVFVETCGASTLGDSCELDEHCDDGCFCNGVERCIGGTCSAGVGPCDDGVDCTVDVCLEPLDQCFVSPDDDRCADGNVCNGREVCDIELGCQPALAPADCDDHIACTLDLCSPETGCTHIPIDADADGDTDLLCGGDDCDDERADVHPGAPEICDNGRDDDCDGLRDYHDTEDCLPTNDDCGTARVLPGPGVYAGSTFGLSAGLSTLCSTSSSGRDAVYRITLPEPTTMHVSVSGSTDFARVSVRPWAVCDQPEYEESYCSEARSPANLRTPTLPAGDYAIIVATGSAGAYYDLVVQFGGTPVETATDVCGADTRMLHDGDLVVGTFLGAEFDYPVSCYPSATRDVAFAFEIDEIQDVHITVRSGQTPGGGGIALLVTPDCDDEDAAVSCSPPREVLSSDSDTWRLDLRADFFRRALEPGRYYVILSSSRVSTYELRVSITDPVPPPPGDACVSAVEITSTPTSIDVTPWINDAQSACSQGFFYDTDGFFTFEVTDGPKDIDLRYVAYSSTTGAALMAASSSSAIELTRVCGDTTSSSRISCDPSILSNVNGGRPDPFTIRYYGLETGRYYIAVRLPRGDVVNRIELSVTPRPPMDVVDNGTCADAMTIDSPTFFHHGTLVGKPITTPGSDTFAFYRLEITERSSVSMLVKPRYPPLTSFARVLGAMYSGTTCTSRISGVANGTAHVALAQTLEPGIYTIAAGARDPAEYELFVFTTPLE